MTDKPITLGTGRLHFRHLGYQMDQTTFNKVYSATIAKESIGEDIYERFINAVMFDVRVAYIVGYNPQKLLPAPSFEREFMQTLAEWAHEQLKKPITDPYWGGPGVGMLYPYQEAALEYISRGGKPSISPLEATQKAMYRYKAPEALIITDAAYDVLQAALRAEGISVAYVRAGVRHESAGGSPTPRGKIEIFDYDDRVMIDLEGEGDLPGRRDIVDDLFSGHFARQLGKTAAMRMKPTVEPIRRQPSYLDHDPTKKHGRRRRGK